MTPSAVSRWFGPAFEDLHPLLQRLHRDDGVLQGEMNVVVGTGWAGWMGRYIARRMHLPLDSPRCAYRAAISHTLTGLRWAREFGDHGALTSEFRPSGLYPDGQWTEEAPGMRLTLQVAIENGGWRWNVVRVHLLGLPLPGFLTFRMEAAKEILNGRYQFAVRFLTPGGRLMLAYEGELEMNPV